MKRLKAIQDNWRERICFNETQFLIYSNIHSIDLFDFIRKLNYFWIFKIQKHKMHDQMTMPHHILQATNWSVRRRMRTTKIWFSPLKIYTKCRQIKIYKIHHNLAENQRHNNTFVVIVVDNLVVDFKYSKSKIKYGKATSRKTKKKWNETKMLFNFHRNVSTYQTSAHNQISFGVSLAKKHCHVNLLHHCCVFMSCEVTTTRKNNKKKK